MGHPMKKRMQYSEQRIKVTMVKLFTHLTVLTSIIITVSINQVQARGGNCGPNVISECNSAWEGYKGKTCEFVCGLCDKCKVYSGRLCPTASTAPKGEAKKLASQRATEEQQFAGNADFSEMPVINELTFKVA